MRLSQCSFKLALVLINIYIKCFFISQLCAFISSSSAQVQNASSKRNDNLFHPTPKGLMRQFVTDRPDATESPYTLDAGHFQFETDLFITERSKIADIQKIVNSYNVANLKLGITHALDVQFITGTFFTSRINDGNLTNKKSGFGGLTIRAKQNIWGNDKGKTAAAILPFINIPTASSEKISGGIIFPVAIELPNEWGLGAQVEGDVASDETGNKYHLGFLASATVSHSLFKVFDFFSEAVVTRNSEIKLFEYFLNAGLVYAISKNVKIDGGVYYGLKSESSKTFFIGISFRI